MCICMYGQNIGPGGYDPEVTAEEYRHMETEIKRQEERDRKLELEFVNPGPRPDE
jgi:hypothetical protein